MFQSLKDVIPSYWQVIVSADRGLYADWLFEEICSLNWHPFLRINHQGTFKINKDNKPKCLDTVVPNKKMCWSGKVTCFKTNPLNCTLLARWDEGYKAPWLIVTDLEPQQADVLWYGLRSWIECSYKDIKSDGWQWQKTRDRDPQRAERLWLAIAVATLWTISVGSDINQHPSDSFNNQLSANHFSKKNPLRKTTGSQISCFLQGLLTILADLLSGKTISLTGLFPLLSPSSYQEATNTNLKFRILRELKLPCPLSFLSDSSDQPPIVKNLPLQGETGGGGDF